MLELLGDNSWIVGKVLVATWETIYMVLISTVLSYLFGLPLGIILVTTAKNHIMENKGLNRVLGSIVNTTRSVPFIIFLILLIPLTRFVVGTPIGTVASIVPLTLAAIPFVARMVETSLKEIEWGLVEAAVSMGASNSQVVSKVLVPEAMPSLLLGFAITAINLVGYSAMAGIVGGGGLGTLAYYYGYQRYEDTVMWITVIVLIILVQGVQMLGDNLAGKIANKRR
ncbi:Methionine import system permease protein MetP [Pelotomaculum schinkii]|uniref:Methionine import system permease protein MetP n=1 Tax=Pelotomaculum schinkii TaxID=78350 RepID=A0A4Y7RB95_9FIRM|nr:methionine ABC transporter permease [Pelotomaculum schinkii]TEB06086.1 Methionine import system permease protein MetP [Pelotomaculum schinkii]